MRIGLLTYHWVPNFGANLQTLSTFLYLKNNNFNPIIINWVPQDTKAWYVKTTDPRQFEVHSSFIKKHFELTREFNSYSELPQVLKDYDITQVVVGSDSLFNLQKPFFNLRKFNYYNPASDHVFPNPFWMKGLKYVPHVGLSISSQNCQYKDFKKNKVELGDALRDFRSITVRDDWTRKMVEYLTDGEIEPLVTPDPVFMFNSNVEPLYTKDELMKKYNLDRDYVLFCFNNGRMKASPKWISYLKEKFNQDGLLCVNLPKSTGGQDLDLDKKINIPLDPLDWYYLIKYTTAYIGVLMHPIVVCLHNSVPFFSFDDYGLRRPFDKSSKIFHILNKADFLENRFSLTHNVFYPDPQSVYDKISDFPTAKCDEFSMNQERDCINNITNLISCLLK